MKLLSFLFLVGCVGCANVQPSYHTISNFGYVDAKRNITRGGQPTREGEIFLQNIGISNIIKLNTDREGNDIYYTLPNFTINQFPITTSQQIFGYGLKQTFEDAYDSITPGTFIHCSHGKNRTGTLVMYYHRKHDNWSKHQCEFDANFYGWSDSLPGLKYYWYSNVK